MAFSLSFLLSEGQVVTGIFSRSYGSGSGSSSNSTSTSNTTAYHVVSSYLIKPTTIIFVSIDIKLYRQFLTILYIKLLDAVFTKESEHTLSWKLSGHFNHILLRHPCISCTLRNTTVCR